MTRFSEWLMRLFGHPDFEPFAPLIDSLRDDPEQWTFGEYRAVNKAGTVDVWTRNGAFGVSVNGMRPSGRSRRRIFRAAQEGVAAKALARVP